MRGRINRPHIRLNLHARPGPPPPPRDRHATAPSRVPPPPPPARAGQRTPAPAAATQRAVTATRRQRSGLPLTTGRGDGPSRPSRPGSLFINHRTQPLQLLRNPELTAAVPPRALRAASAPLHRQHIPHIRRQQRRDLGQVLVTDLGKLAVVHLAPDHQVPHDLVGLPERCVPRRTSSSATGRWPAHARRRATRHQLGIEPQGGHQPGQRREQPSAGCPRRRRPAPYPPCRSWS